MNVITIEKICRETIDYAKEKNMTLFGLSANKTIEKIGSYLLAEEGIHLDKISSGKIIDRLKAEDFIQLPVYLQMKMISTYRNYVAHIGDPKEGFFKHTKSSFFEILKWFYKDYLDNEHQYLSLKYSYTQSNTIKEATAIYVVEEADLREQNALMFKTIHEMSQQIKNLTKKIDQIDQNIKITNKLLLDLQSTVKGIKDTALETEEKIHLIYGNLDEILLDQREIERYTSLVKQWIDFDWSSLDHLSQQFLTTAEYLFAELSKVPTIDLSPFILQYCRTLENELLIKVFRSYIQYIKDNNIDVQKIFEWDLKSRGSTNNFANRVDRYASNPKEEKWRFELGTMIFILKLLNKPIAKKSPLLKNFKDYIYKYFSEHLIDLHFLKDLQHINYTFRNPAAHRDIFNIHEAKEGRKQIRKTINQLLQTYDL